MWECKSALFCECMEVDSSTSRTLERIYISLLSSHSKNKYKVCYKIVDAIVQRDITKLRDILPALSGLAQHFEKHGAGRYLAGLWFQDLPQRLLWKMRGDYGASRATPYRSPSWSWASVRFRFRRQVYQHDGGEMESGHKLEPIWTNILEAVSISKGSDPLGAVSADHLKVHAPLLEAFVWRSRILDSLRQVINSPRIHASFDFPYDSEKKSCIAYLSAN
ncbi:hypothetical protein BS50DRAFT_587625 [Corynespora cassiicola Philippines]|uniref:Uncharacterized protein n=1 Tax=Corynespora cassiicola Philippines TaxID=1448308 RepID=A0A2T2NSQ3_CORCC|nr:hypothetical protein BS50DRAFT_587625 [Corynespora cassiicola Philippines]